MSTYKEQIITQYQLGSLFPEDSPLAVSCFEKIVQIADENQDVEWQLKGRMLVVKAATFAFMPDIMLRDFAYLLGYLDRQPEVLEEHVGSRMILWAYKWAVDKLPLFPNISIAKIEETLADMENRFLAHGPYQKTVAQYHFLTYSKLGNVELADKALDRYYKIEVESPLDDCVACFRSGYVNHLIKKGHFLEAIDESQPILEGKESCATVPKNFYHCLLLPLLLEDRKPEALEIAKKINPAPQLDKLELNGAMILLWLVNGQISEALECFEKNVQLAHQSRDRYYAFKFFLYSQPLFEYLIKKGELQVSLNLKEEGPLFNESGKYESTAIKTYLDQQISSLEQAFNERNQNELFSRLREQVEAVVEKYVF